MIGAVSAQALSDAGARVLASEWGGPPTLQRGARLARPVRRPPMQPQRSPAAI